MGTHSCGRSPLIYRLWVCELFMKTLIIISIIYQAFINLMCYSLGAYILLFNKYINLIISSDLLIIYIDI